MSDQAREYRDRLRSVNLHLNRRTFIGASAGAMAAALLAACGGGGEQTESGQPSGGTSATQPASGGAAPTTAPVRGVQIPQFDNPKAGQPSGTKPDELVVALGVNQLTTHGIDPQLHVGTAAECQLRHMYEPLVKFEADLQTISPALATAWNRLDPLTTQFKLRQGIKYHNGEPFNAEAVRYSVLRPLSDETPGDARSTYSIISDVEVVDEYTVNVKTKQPDPALLARMTGFHMTMVAPKWAAQGPKVVAAEANGTGPYKLVSWKPNEDLVMEANPDYWGGAPEVKRVRFRVISEQATRVAAMRSGQVHVAKDIPPEEMDAINQSGRARVARAVSNRVPFYFITVEVDQYKDKRVRQAINYAANVQGVIDAVLLGNGHRVSTVLPIWCYGYDPSLQPYPNDPEKAKQLLTDAGFANGIDISIWYIQGRYPKDKEVAEAMAQEMAKAGIRCKTELRESAVLTDLQQKKQTPGLVFASWGNWIFDADNTFVPLFGCESAKQYGDWRRPYGCNDDLEKVLQDARVELDTEKRTQLYAQAQRMLYDDAGALFMYQLVDIFGIDNWVNWTPRHDEMIWAHEMKWSTA